MDAFPPPDDQTPADRPAPDTPPTAAPNSDSTTWAIASHLSALVQVFGIPAPIGPLVVWLLKKDEDPFVAYHAKEALNFNISFFIYGAVAALSMLLLIGFVLLPAVLITWLVLMIIATIRASEGKHYQYPLTIRFVS